MSCFYLEHERVVRLGTAVIHRFGAAATRAAFDSHAAGRFGGLRKRLQIKIVIKEIRFLEKKGQTTVACGDQLKS